MQIRPLAGLDLPGASRDAATSRAPATGLLRTRRLAVLLLCLALAPVASTAAYAAAALSSEKVEAWLAAFSQDHDQRGPIALSSRLDQARLAERAAALDGLGEKEKARRMTLIGQKLTTARVAYANFRHLTIGRRTDAGDHWTVLTHYNSDDGMFLYRRLRLEADPAGAVRLADWADIPCDIEMAEEVATLALLQLRETGEAGALPPARRAELEFYRENPFKLMRLWVAIGTTPPRPDTFRALFAELPPAARFGLVAREARTRWFVSVPKEWIAGEIGLIVGPENEDPLRGLLMFRAGLRAGRPEIALHGIELLGSLLGDDLMWRVERAALLDQAGRLDEAAAWARETAELYPSMFAAHTQHLAALRRAGRLDEAERRAVLLAGILGTDTAALVVKNAVAHAEELEAQSRGPSPEQHLAASATPPPPQTRLPSRARLDPSVFEMPAIDTTLRFDLGGTPDAPTR